MYGYCEDYPCCGHTDQDPCPGRGAITVPWYCDLCGCDHAASWAFLMPECPEDQW